MSVYDIACQYIDAGLSVVPLRTDGSKTPPAGCKWAPFQVTVPSKDQAYSWFVENGHEALAIVTGVVSGGLEVIDFDAPELFKPWANLLKEAGAEDLLRSLPMIETPRGGWHVYYRCPEIQGNQRLAQRAGTDKNGKPCKIALIETRGEHGYVVAPGSNPSVNGKTANTQKIYQPKWKDLFHIPLITPEDRGLLISAAQCLTEIVEEEENFTPGDYTSNAQGDSLSDRPGDDFNARASWGDVLLPHGWRLCFERQGEGYWKRPGKTDRGWSATTNYHGNGLLRIFSSNASPFQDGRAYSKFRAYAHLNHGGDFKAAAKALAAKGYGKKLEAVVSYVIPPKDRELIVETTARIEAVNDSDLGINRYDEFLEALAAVPYTDMANARRLMLSHGENIRFVEERGWYQYSGKKWEPGADGHVMELCKDVARKLYRELSYAPVELRGALLKHAKDSQERKRLTNMRALAESEPGIKESITAFDSDPYALCVENGTINLLTGELQEHDPKDYHSRLIRTPYDPAAQCPLWLDTLDYVFAGNQDVIDYVQRAAGYSLSGDVSEQCLFVLHGNGMNGKSVIADTLLALAGDYGINCDIETFTESDKKGISNDLARLAGARFVRTNETAHGAYLNEKLLKQATSGESARITARFLHREFFDFCPRFKLWIDGNHLPQIRGSDEGIWRRLMVLHFPVWIPPEKRNKHLCRDLVGELPGILAWAVRGFRWFRELGGLMPPDSVSEANDKYRKSMNLIMAFVEECCSVEQGATINAKVLYQTYNGWCKDYNYRPLGNARFRQELEQYKVPGNTHLIKLEKDLTGFEYRGIRLKQGG